MSGADQSIARAVNRVRVERSGGRVEGGYEQSICSEGNRVKVKLEKN